MSVQGFPVVPVALPEMAVLKRLGYNRHLTEVPPAQAARIRGWMGEAFALCAFAGRAAVLAVRARGAGYVELEDGTRWESARLAETLAPFARVAVFAVTAGAAVGAAARAKIAAGDGAAALVYDATASESVEAAADWLDAFLCRRHGVPARGNHRFSPGYFDWPLAAQASIDRILDFSALGVALTPSFQLSPEKTVTAVKGV